MEEDSAFKMLAGNLQDRGLQKGLGGDEGTILEWILKKLISVRETELSRLRIGTLVNSGLNLRIP